MDNIVFHSDWTVNSEQVREAMEHLTLIHSKEVPAASEKDPSINWEFYSTAEADGGFKLYALTEDGNLIGYATYWLGAFPSCGSSSAYMETLYLTKEHRGTGIAGWFIAKCEEDLINNYNIETLSLHTDGSNTHSNLAKSLGYDRFEVNYFKKV